MRGDVGLIAKRAMSVGCSRKLDIMRITTSCSRYLYI